MKFVKYKNKYGIVIDSTKEFGTETCYLVQFSSMADWLYESEIEFVNLFEISQVVQDEKGNFGTVCIKWEDGLTFSCQDSSHILK